MCIANERVKRSIQCTSDVSPAPAKIIMYEGSKKYALRGERQIQIANEALMGTGAYVMDDHFKTAPQVFKQFATRLWQQHKIKKF